MRLEFLSEYVILGKFFYFGFLICPMGRKISADAIERGR